MNNYLILNTTGWPLLSLLMIIPAAGAFVTLLIRGDRGLKLWVKCSANDRAGGTVSSFGMLKTTPSGKRPLQRVIDILAVEKCVFVDVEPGDPIGIGKMIAERSIHDVEHETFGLLKMLGL